MATSKLNLTRDQLASFLKDHELIKQFERLFADVSQLEPTTLNDLALSAGNADQKAIEALSLISSLAQDVAASSAAADNKATQALESIASLTQDVATSLAATDNNAMHALTVVVALAQETQVQLAVADSKASAALAQVQALADIVQGLQVAPPPREFKRSRYGSFYDTTTQTAAVINTAYAMTFNTTDISRGVFVGSPISRIVVDESSLYDFQFSAQFDNTSGGNHLVRIWLRKDGVDVANSAGEVRLTGNDGEMVASWNYFIELAAGSYVELMWAVSDTAVQITARPAVAPVPAIPSVILTVSNNIQGVQ